MLRREFVLVNAVVHTGDEVLVDHALHVRDGVIVGLVPAQGLDRGAAEVIDLGGHSIAPGFIDLQVNGGGDVLFNDVPSTETVIAMAAAHRRFGTTDLLPTFVTGSIDDMGRASNAVAQAIADGEAGVLGIHFEGPLLNRARLGVHDAAHVQDVPTDGLLDLFTGDIDGRPGSTLVTVAPERVGAGFIRSLTSRGVRVAAGHTDADAGEVAAAIDAGLRGGTHVWNAMRPLTSRDPGAVGALLADDRVWCGFIADGHHVSFATLALSLRCKPPGRAFVVTDAVGPVGGTSTSFVLGPHRVTVEDGRCVTADGTLAGSAADMAAMVRNLVHHVGVPRDEALRMASRYPAEFLGISDRRGRIAAGYPAHLVVLDDEMRVSGVVYGGAFREG